MGDIIDISNLDVKEIKSSSNFGGGIELLMNDKKSKSTDENKELDIINLEQELNSLTIDAEPIRINDDIQKVTFDTNIETSNIGSEFKNLPNNNDEKTWDGYGKFNDIPVNPDASIPKQSMTGEEILKEKFNYLRKLEQLEKKGVQLTKKYSMDSNLMEMMGEYDLIMSEKEVLAVVG